MSNIVNAKKRNTFIYISGNISDGVGLNLWRGVLKKTRKIDANLICYMGEGLGEDNASLIYNLIDVEKTDGIISWAVSIKDKHESFYDRFKGHPFVALSVPIPGFPVVTADSYQGMREVVGHLIKEHSYTKIALVRGPENHIYSAQRYNAYIDALKENNILDENLITPPLSWAPEAGIEGIKILLDERKLKPGIDIEAVVFISDNPALAGFTELKRRKIQIPKQLSITGYNATQEALSASTPITNVVMPFVEQGSKAVDLLIKLLNKEEIPIKTVLPAKLLVAQSCGCQSPNIADAAAKIETTLQKEQKTQSRLFFKTKKTSSSTVSRKAALEQILKELIEYARSNEFTGPIITENSGTLLEAFFNEIENNQQGEFLLHFREIISELIHENENIAFLQNIISIFRRNLILYTESTGITHAAEDLWSQARVMVAEAMGRVKDNECLAKSKQEKTLREISIKLITNYNMNMLMDILAESLPKLEIPSCYVSLYENPADIKSLFDLPQKARLILAYEGGNRKEIDAEGIVYPSMDLLPQGISSDSRQMALVVHSLNFHDRHIGFVVFEAGPEEGSLYSILGNLLSSALHGALLSRKNEKTYELLQKTLNNVQHKSKVVSQRSNNISRNVSDISSSMGEAAASVREMSKNIARVMEIVKDAVKIANGANTEIMDLTKKSQKIGDITNIIIDIAEQTKILSLNAAIEAARAGEKGRGFTIVAAEVSTLAKRTVAATNEITSMINTIQSQTGETAKAITQVVNTIDNVSDLSINITSAISQQAAVTNEISSLLMTAAEGSKEIYEAISELAALADTE